MYIKSKMKTNRSEKIDEGNECSKKKEFTAVATGRIAAEYKSIKDNIGLTRHFEDICGKSQRQADERNFAESESAKAKNIAYNRYSNVRPYDHSRIKLNRGSNDYINANLLPMKRFCRQYILTQGPLSNSVGHFWLMVSEQHVNAIVMLNNLMERNQEKCFKYWPDATGTENALKFDKLKLIVEHLRMENYSDYKCRYLKITDVEAQQSREITQFHFTAWPDFDVPSTPKAFLQFLQHISKSGCLDPNQGPVIVHCSAGIGRSGTFCLVDCCLAWFEREGEDMVSVQDALIEMRQYRNGLVQTADQLDFAYQAIIEGIQLLQDPKLVKKKSSNKS